MIAATFAERLNTQVITPRQVENGSLGYIDHVVLPPVLASDSESTVSSEDEQVDEYTSGTRKHTYRSLGTHEIRLLVLNPGDTNDPLECFLEHYSVNNTKSYQALSYVWGSPGEGKTIKLDGCCVQVTPNLYEFLVSFRLRGTTCVLWIDALCINQADIAERNSQIRLMKRVYEGADSVVIWLGQETEDTQIAIQIIEDIWYDFRQRPLDMMSSTVEAISNPTAEDLWKFFGQIPSPVQDETTLEQEASRAWKGIQDLLNRTWWTRVWVIQEATAPTRRNSLVFCGNLDITFKKILFANKLFNEFNAQGNFKHRFPEQIMQTAEYIETYSELRRDYQETGRNEFLRMSDLLMTFREFSATNARDKLYALIPTSLDGAELLDVDYGLPVEEVYINAALSFIQTYRNLDILGYCTEIEAKADLKLPSWVPNWVTTNTVITPFLKRRFVHDCRTSTNDSESESSELIIINAGEVRTQKLYDAALNSTAEIRVDLQRSIQSLFCKGFKFDAIEAVSPAAYNTEHHSREVGNWVQWLGTIGLHCYDKYTAGKESESIEDALSRILVADCMRVRLDIGSRGHRTDILQDEEFPATHREGSGTASRNFGIPKPPTSSSPYPASLHRKLIVTNKGYIGLTAKHVEVGDIVAILAGGQLPFVLRPTEEHYILIGEAYIHGIMDGEAVQLQKSTTNADPFLQHSFEIR